MLCIQLSYNVVIWLRHMHVVCTTLHWY